MTKAPDRQVRPCGSLDMDSHRPPRFITVCAETLALIDEARRVSPYRVPVLLTGESGTGKEVLARLMHLWSGRRGSFIPVNAASLRGDLLESALFGHVRGAFTGAFSRNPGLAAAAAGGTLFIDEIGEMDLPSQSRLLRFLDSGEYVALGSSTAVRSDAGIITATNRELKAAVRAGSFREDLYYRISTVVFDIPPLRERRADVLPLARHFAGVSKGRFAIDAVEFSGATLRMLPCYDWPGNVRQLRNEILSAALRKSGGYIEPTDLSREILEACTSSRTGPGPGSGLDARLDEYERAEIFDALRMAGSNCSRAAEILGLKRTTLLYRMRRHGIMLREGRRSGPDAAGGES